MAEELWIARVEREAAEKVAALVALPLPTEEWEQDDEHFDPWRLFPAIYGTYSGEYDHCVVDVLTELRDGTKKRHDLGAEIFREMLCVSHLCSYGTSPRVCFPTSDFQPLLPPLIVAWKQWYAVHWNATMNAA